ncbi:MAG: DUF1080 domain-containing protein [Planctomycetales bacterium]|nr:DUF1080 domain-containing protein [Planctomycetales bacterium]
MKTTLLPHATVMLAIWLLLPGLASGQSTQNPSPMVEHSRPHPRLQQPNASGPPELVSPISSGEVAWGNLYVAPSRSGQPHSRRPLWIHFHGADWVAQSAARQTGAACLAVQLGSGSSVYAKPFADPKVFTELLAEIRRSSPVELGPVYLSGWSAGYGAIREIVRDSDNVSQIAGVLLLDGMHASYVNGKPGPLESELVTADIEPFVALGRRAIAGELAFVVTHTEIFPGTFASTTETADYLLKTLDVERQSALAWGPFGTQQLSEAEAGKFRLLGFAGNSAPDHVDLLHATAQFWQMTEVLAGSGDSGEWIELFDGLTLAGWEGPEGVFRAERGSIVGGSLTEAIPRNEFLCTERSFGDFELQLQAKMIGRPGRNAGVQVRSERIEGSHEISGYQCDMAEGALCLWGSLYDESRRNRYLDPADQAGQEAFSTRIERLIRYDEWNDFTIRCVGPRIQVWVNGYPTIDYTEPDADIARKGVIGLQIHGGPPSEAWYRSIRIRELK